MTDIGKLLFSFFNFLLIYIARIVPYLLLPAIIIDIIKKKFRFSKYLLIALVSCALIYALMQLIITFFDITIYYADNRS